MEGIPFKKYLEMTFLGSVINMRLPWWLRQ